MQVVPDAGEEGSQSKQRPRGSGSASARCRGQQGAMSLEPSELDQREWWKVGGVKMLGDCSEPIQTQAPPSGNCHSRGWEEKIK